MQINNYSPHANASLSLNGLNESCEQKQQTEEHCCHVKYTVQVSDTRNDAMKSNSR